MLRIAVAAKLRKRELLDVGEDLIGPAARLIAVGAAVGVADPPRSPAAAGKMTVGVLEVQHPQRKLLFVILALHHPRRLARRLHRRQQ